MTTTLVELVMIDCCSCCIRFAVPSSLYNRRRNDHQHFWCPAGHSQRFTGKSDAEKLREQLDAAREVAAREGNRRRAAEETADAERRSAVAYRGHATRLRRRIAAGLCPACHREFPDLAGHVADEHPGYAADTPNAQPPAAAVAAGAVEDGRI